MRRRWRSSSSGAMKEKKPSSPSSLSSTQAGYPAHTLISRIVSLHTLTQLSTIRALVGPYAARLADDYHITLERPFVRDTRNALALRTARLSAGLSLEALAEASGVDITRLQDAEDTESRVDLTFDEWVRLAVVFEGHTLAEFKVRQIAKGVVKYLVQGDQMLESARGLVQYYFSDDAPVGENT